MLYQDYYDQGLEKLKAKDPQGAMMEFNRAIQFNPQFGDAYYQRARLSSGLRPMIMWERSQIITSPFCSNPLLAPT